jgi:hypothetical protein
MSKRFVIGTATGLVLIIIIFAGVSAYVRTHTTRAAAPCVVNLMVIEGDKQQWAVGNNKTSNDVPTWEDLRPYFPHSWTNGKPVCPEGGFYTLGRVGDPPTCSIGGPGHSMPQ